ncbi:hypothetical protein GMSM_03900 [Geomonas sp. Red276]
MKFVRTFAATAALIAATAATSFALTANTNYTITSAKLNSNGTVSAIETVPATTDANGLLTFSLSTVPTNAQANFLVFTIADQNGNVVRKGIVPAPPTGDVNQLGINDLATAQATTFLKAAELAGSDDPILAGYLLVLLRYPNIQDSDVVKLGNLGKAAILGNGGFEGYLQSSGISASQLSALKACLIYNSDSNKNTLRNITKQYYTAVNSGDATTETTETQKAGGLMADVFMDAAACAGIDLDYITSAHDAAGDAANATGLMSGPDGISPNLMSSLDQSMSAFNRKIGMVKMVTNYTNALNTLQATGGQVDTFIGAAQAMATTSNTVETQYGDFFRDPATYLAAHPGATADSVQNAINTIYSNAWTTFQGAIAASNTEIAALKAAVIAAFPGIQLPPDFGVNYDGSQNPPNWPVQQVVMVNWMVNLIKQGGSIGYTRDTLPIPSNMQGWMGSCSIPQDWNMMTCQQAGGTWTPGRNTFDTPSAAFNAYLGIQQDVNIAWMTRSSIWDNGNQPTSAQRIQATTDFINNLANIQSKIVAMKAGNVPASDAEKKAIILLMLQPQID